MRRDRRPLLAALLIFGPDRLPGLAREAASGVKRVREVVSGVRADLDDAWGDDVGQLRDLDPRRFSPKSLVRRHLLDGDDGSA